MENAHLGLPLINKGVDLLKANSLRTLQVQLLQGKGKALCCKEYPIIYEENLKKKHNFCLHMIG